MTTNGPGLPADVRGVTRRATVGRLLAAMGGATLSLPTPAQAWPSRAVKVLVGAPPGGPVDFLARIFSDAAAPMLGQSVVVDNRAGASGTIAAAAAAKAADGHTLLASGPSAIVNAPHMIARLEYDPTKDFQPVALLGAGAFVLAVHPQVPARTLTEFIALGRARPGALNYGSGGQGSSGHLCTEAFAQASGVQLTHVPYKGDGQAVTDLVGGQIQFMFTAPNVAAPHVAEGRLRLLAVTSRERIAKMPDVPAVHESLPNFEYLGWVILFAPTGTPAAAAERLAAVWAQSRDQAPIKGRLMDLGMAPPARLGDRANLVTFLGAERERTATLVQRLGLKPA